MAAQNGHTKVVRLLLDRRADVDAANTVRMDPATPPSPKPTCPVIAAEYSSRCRRHSAPVHEMAPIHAMTGEARHQASVPARYGHRLTPTHRAPATRPIPPNSAALAVLHSSDPSLCCTRARLERPPGGEFEPRANVPSAPWLRRAPAAFAARHAAPRVPGEARAAVSVHRYLPADGCRAPLPCGTRRS